MLGKKIEFYIRGEITIHELITVRTIYSCLCNASGITKNKKNVYDCKINSAGTGKA